MWSGSAHFGMHSHLRIMENTFDKNHYTHMRQRLQTSFNKAVSFYMHGAGCYHLCNDIKQDSRHLCASPQITVYSSSSSPFVYLLVHYLAYAFWVLQSLSVHLPFIYVMCSLSLMATVNQHNCIFSATLHIT